MAHNICEVYDLLGELENLTSIKKSNIKRGLKETPCQYDLEKDGLFELFNYANFCVNNGVLYLDHENPVTEAQICGDKKQNVATSQMATCVTKAVNVSSFSGKKSGQSKRSMGRRIVQKGNFIRNLNDDFATRENQNLVLGGHASPSNHR
jgi:hypothetical protein